MSDISRISLEDTLNLIQLAREAALVQGRAAQAERLSPVINQMQSLVSDVKNSQPASTQAAGLFGQDDFKKLLDVAQSVPANSSAENSMGNIMDRNRMVQAMFEANMSNIDIARQFGITREEVDLILSVNNRRNLGVEVYR